MRRKLLSALLALATFAIVWLVASPASAAGAPVCDPRGATVFAPPPQQQDPEQSLDIVVNDDDCTQSPLERKHIVPNRAPSPHGSLATQEPATSSALVAVPRLPLASPRLAAPDADAHGARPGFPSSLDRPPRA